MFRPYGDIIRLACKTYQPFKAHWSRDAQPVYHSTTVRSAHTVFMCFVFIWEQTATCATYSINWLVCITQMKSVYSAVRTGSLNKAVCASALKGRRVLMIKIKYSTFNYILYYCPDDDHIVSKHAAKIKYKIYTTCIGRWGHAAGGAVGWGTALEAGRSCVRFSMVSLEFFINILLAWPWGWLSL